PQGVVPDRQLGECGGYMGGGVPRPFFTVRAITHRRDPIFYGYISQHPPSESTMIQGQANECIMHKLLVDDLGEPSVTDVSLNQTHGGLMGHVIVQMTPQYPG